MIDTSNFGPRDAKVIRENDGKTPYELLQLGLTQKAYDRLIAGDYKELGGNGNVTIEPTGIIEDKEPQHSFNATAQPSNIVQPTVKEVTKSKTQLTAPQVYAKQKISSNLGSVQVTNKRTGRTQTMSANAAKRLLKQPNLYLISK